MKICYFKHRDEIKGYLTPDYNSIAFDNYEEAATMAELLIKTGFAVLIKPEDNIFVLEWRGERVTDDYGTDCLVWLSPDEYEDIMAVRSERLKEVVDKLR